MPQAKRRSQVKEEKLMVLFDRGKETKNKVRFEERSEEHEPIVGTLYLHKRYVERLGNPDGVQVTLERVR